VLDSLAGRRVYIDANVFIYFLDQLTTHADAATAILEDAAAGRFAAVTGQAVVAEVMVGPYRQGDPLVIRKVKEFFASAVWLDVVDHPAQAFDDAALLRATSGMPFIDALHVSTASLSRCDVVLTQDARMKPGLGVDVVTLPVAGR
jgi:predicted nucleic acid-binding protein